MLTGLRGTAGLALKPSNVNGSFTRLMPFGISVGGHFVNLLTLGGGYMGCGGAGLGRCFL